MLQKAWQKRWHYQIINAKPWKFWFLKKACQSIQLLIKFIYAVAYLILQKTERLLPKSKKSGTIHFWASWVFNYEYLVTTMVNQWLTQYESHQNVLYLSDHIYNSVRITRELISIFTITQFLQKIHTYLVNQLSKIKDILKLQQWPLEIITLPKCIFRKLCEWIVHMKPSILRDFKSCRPIKLRVWENVAHLWKYLIIETFWTTIQIVVWWVK